MKKDTFKKKFEIPLPLTLIIMIVIIYLFYNYNIIVIFYTRTSNGLVISKDGVINIDIS